MTISLAGLAAVLLPAVRRGRAAVVPTGLVLGGALSNLADRAVLGNVRDMLPVGHLVVINPADIAILIGLVWLLTATVRRPRLASVEEQAELVGR